LISGYITNCYGDNPIKDKACTLLINEDKTINQIAGMLGFQNQSYFSKFFKKKMGVSPSEYRKGVRV